MATQIKSEDLAVHPLFKVLTRPPMVFGVTLDYFFVIAIVAFCAFILANNPFYGLIFLPLYVCGWKLCHSDPFIFSVLTKRGLGQYSPNKHLWGCISYEPF